MSGERERAERWLAQLNPPVPLGEDPISKAYLLARDVLALVKKNEELKAKSEELENAKR